MQQSDADARGHEQVHAQHYARRAKRNTTMPAKFPPRNTIQNDPETIDPNQSKMIQIDPKRSKTIQTDSANFKQLQERRFTYSTQCPPDKSDVGGIPPSRQPRRCRHAARPPPPPPPFLPPLPLLLSPPPPGSLYITITETHAPPSFRHFPGSLCH